MALVSDLTSDDRTVYRAVAELRQVADRIKGRPASYPRRIYRGVRAGFLSLRFGPVGVGRAAWLAARFGVPRDFLTYFKLASRADAGLFLDNTELEPVRHAIPAAAGVDLGVLRDKPTFARICAEHGLPTPPILATLRDGQCHEVSDAWPDGDLFSKHASGLCGQGVRLWRRVAPGRWAGDAETVYNRDGLIATLASLSAAESISHILQPCLANHPELAGLTSGGLCTVRVVTIRFPEMPSEHLLSIFRMPTGGAVVDNFAAGGLAAPIVDTDRGVLGTAVCKKGVSRIDRHPDGSRIIPGTQLPFWSESLELCKRAHDVAFPAFASIGWDVGLTADGPMLVEGNSNWCSYLTQASRDQGLGATRVVECYLAHLRRLGLVDSGGQYD